MLREALEKTVSRLRERKRRLFEAFAYQQAISRDEYLEEKARLDEEITLAEMKANDAKLAEGDIAGLLDFAETILLDPANFWIQCSPEQKQRLQQVLFPAGVEFADRVYRTSETPLMFSLLQPDEAKEEVLVAPPGIEPGSAA